MENREGQGNRKTRTNKQKIEGKETINIGQGKSYKGQGNKKQRKFGIEFNSIFNSFFYRTFNLKLKTREFFSFGLRVQFLI